MRQRSRLLFNHLPFFFAIAGAFQQPSKHFIAENPPSFPRSSAIPRMAAALELVASSTCLTSSGAAAVMAAAEAVAFSNGWCVSICVSDAGGVPIQVHRNDAFPASVEIAMGKARTAALFQKKTSALESGVNVADGSARTALLSAPFVLMGGGVPILCDGRVVGSVGVSGVTPAQDEEVANAGASAT